MVIDYRPRGRSYRIKAQAGHIFKAMPLPMPVTLQNAFHTILNANLSCGVAA